MAEPPFVLPAKPLHVFMWSYHSTSHFVEPPELVAERLVRYARCLFRKSYASALPLVCRDDRPVAPPGAGSVCMQWTSSAVARDRVMAGVDGGFGTFAGRVQGDATIVWLKLQALVEGVRLASQDLWQEEVED